MYKLASAYVKNFVIYLDLLFYFVPDLQLILYVRVFLADHNVMPGYHIIAALPNKNKKKHKRSKIFKK